MAASTGPLAGSVDNMISLLENIDVQKATCLNSSADSNLAAVLKGDGVLMSDPDVSSVESYNLMQNQSNDAI